MCIYMGVRKFGPFQFQNRAFIYFLFKKGGVYHIPGGAHQYYVIYRVTPLLRLLTIYGAGSFEQKIDLYNIHGHKPEGCCFMVFTDLVISV